MTVRLIYFLLLMPLFTVSGCALSKVNTAWPEPRALGRDIPAYRPPHKRSGGEGDTLEVKESLGMLTLRQTLALALMKNPELAAFSWEVRAGEARALQEALLPNPELEFEVEGYDAEGTGFDTTERTIALSQLVELGGKRRKRAKVAKLERSLAGWDYEAKRLDVFVETTQAFVDVLAAQERLTLFEAFVGVAEKVHHAVVERVGAGKVSPLEGTKAKVELSISQIELKQAKRELESARKRLAATWGSTTAGFTQATGDFETTIGRIPSADQLLQEIQQNPDMARWDTEIELREATVELGEAGRIPDLSASAGLQHFEETGDDAFAFGLSLSLPLFDRNQGGVQEARHQLSKAREQRKAREVATSTSLAEVYQELSSSYSEVVALKKDVLPAAQAAFDAAQTGYQQGKLGYLDVLDAQRTLFESKAQYVDALSVYHKAAADLERLVGRSLEDINNTSQEK